MFTTLIRRQRTVRRTIGRKLLSCITKLATRTPLEVRQFYIKLAMASAALAAELERVPDHAHVESYRYDSSNDRSPRM